MPASMLALIVVLGVAHIVVRLRGGKGPAGVLKPLPIALLALTVLRADHPGDPTYRGLVVAALLASMAGDVFLLSPRRFVPGLLSFLVAHVLYVVAFVPAVTLGAAAWAFLLPFLGFGGIVLRYLWPHLGRYRAPVLVYVGVISTMGWLATLRALGGAVTPASGMLALVGAGFFMTSDTILAVDRFARPFPSGPAFVMGTYYVAQILLAWSALV